MKGSEGARRRTLASAVFLVAFCVLALAASADGGMLRSTKGAAAVEGLTLYAAPSQFQYDDFADDRARGVGHNPFGNYKSPYTALPSDELNAGPFAGDEAFLTYKLYTDSTLKNDAGSAIVVCQYGLKKSSFCDASFQLQQGTLVGFDTSTFSSTTYTLAITGGTDAYRGVKGEMTASLSPSAGKHAFPMFAIPHGIVGQPQQLKFAILPETTGSGTHRITQYAYPVDQQYLDHNDDEARGDENNPFGPRLYPQCKGLVHSQEVTCAAAITHAASVTIQEHNNGPFPGDQSVFSFKTYANANRTDQTGTAVLICQYDFDRIGYCDVAYKLKGGTLFGAGALDFDAKQFTFAITEGSGDYQGMSGDVEGTQASNNVVRLAFTLA